jgi:hypothetical protein
MKEHKDRNGETVKVAVRVGCGVPGRCHDNRASSTKEKFDEILNDETPLNVSITPIQPSNNARIE